MIFDHQAEHPSQWAAINSIAGKIGCTGETLRSWVWQAERDQGLRGVPTTEDSETVGGGVLGREHLWGDGERAGDRDGTMSARITCGI